MDIPTPIDYCTATQNFAKSVMEYVIKGEVGKIKATYLVYSGDRDKLILKRALTNYTSPNMVSPTEFSIREYTECTSGNRYGYR